MRNTSTEHPFRGSERRLLLVALISLVVMVAEIAGGTVFGSMSLLADGWHMGTHVLALGIAYAASIIAGRYAGDTRFSVHKINALGGFTGAMLLAVVAAEMLVKGAGRLMEPAPIRFEEAIVVAVVGLVVNVAGAFILRRQPHGHNHSHDHEHPVDTDHNLRAAYLHVITDAFTSVLAIGALTIGRFTGWLWLDAAVAIVGSAVIARWSAGLLRSAGATLLDIRDDR
jgi:cation diffusion facilitator family transporter